METKDNYIKQLEEHVANMETNVYSMTKDYETIKEKNLVNLKHNINIIIDLHIAYKNYECHLDAEKEEKNSISERDVKEAKEKIFILICSLGHCHDEASVYIDSLDYLDGVIDDCLKLYKDDDEYIRFPTGGIPKSKIKSFFNLTKKLKVLVNDEII